MNDMTPIGKTEIKKQWALDLASRGVPLILLHHTNPDGSCTCGRPSKPADPAARVKGTDYCGSQGKHPIGSEWQENTTTDSSIIAGWFEHNPESNYGCVAGAERFILDIDVKGDDGYATAKELLGVDSSGLDSLTFAVKTPSGGMHLYFAADKVYGNQRTYTSIIDRRPGNFLALRSGLKSRSVLARSLSRMFTSPAFSAVSYKRFMESSNRPISSMRTLSSPTLSAIAFNC